MIVSQPFVLFALFYFKCCVEADEISIWPASGIGDGNKHGGDTTVRIGAAGRSAKRRAGREFFPLGHRGRYRESVAIDAKIKGARDVKVRNLFFYLV